MNNTPNFKTFFDIEKYKKIVLVELEEKLKATINKNNGLEDKIDFRKIFDLKEELLTTALIDYINERAKNKLMFDPVNGDTHKSNFLKKWHALTKGKLLNKENDNDIYLISNMFRWGVAEAAPIMQEVEKLCKEQNITLNNTDIIQKIINSKEVQEIINTNYNKAIDYINKGDFGRAQLHLDTTCLNCDCNMQFQMNDWKPKLFTYDMKQEKGQEYRELKECFENKIYEVNIDFPTGEVLVADWFRIEEFTKQVEFNKDYKLPSINSALGRKLSTEHAAKLGFLTVHVGNSSPTIYEYNGKLVFGHIDEYENRNLLKEENIKETGWVCTDLWNVTVIDKKKLIEIIAQKIGIEGATQEVDKYIKENDVSILALEPGEYKVRYSPFEEELLELKSKDINGDDIMDETDKKLQGQEDIEIIFEVLKNSPKKKLKLR